MLRTLETTAGKTPPSHSPRCVQTGALSNPLSSQCEAPRVPNIPEQFWGSRTRLLAPGYLKHTWSSGEKRWTWSCGRADGAEELLVPQFPSVRLVPYLILATGLRPSSLMRLVIPGGLLSFG